MSDNLANNILPQSEGIAEMSDHETLMWRISADPWMNPNGAGLAWLDRPVDFELFQRQIANAVAQQPRLRQKVVDDGPSWMNPRWVPVTSFNLDDHVESISLDGSASDSAVLALASRLYTETLDPSRPVWRFVAIDGLASGRGAVWFMIHHTIGDGIGQVKMAEAYQSLERDDPGPPPIDLDAIISRAAEQNDHSAFGRQDQAKALANQALSLAKFQANSTRKLVGELALWPTDPSRVQDRAAEVGDALKGLLGPLVALGPALGGSDTGGSPLWTDRSASRQLEHVTVPLDKLKKAAKSHGSSINDAFLSVIANATVAYHRDREVDLGCVNTSFVVSTRTKGDKRANAFTPVALRLSGASASLPERMSEVHTKALAARHEAAGAGGISSLSGALNMLPQSVITSAARAQASRIDVATSNLRGAPFPVYIAGGRMTGSVTQGPLAGTPCNATAFSAENNFDIGLFIDPVAIAEPPAFAENVRAAFDELLS